MKKYCKYLLAASPVLYLIVDRFLDSWDNAVNKDKNVDAKLTKNGMSLSIGTDEETASDEDEPDNDTSEDIDTLYIS